MIAAIDAFPPQSNRISELQRTISATRLGTWLQCRLKFHFKYVLKITRPPTASLHVGRSVHWVLKEWNKARWRREPFAKSRFKRLFVRGWREENDGIDWDGGEKKLRRLGWAMLETYFAQTPIGLDERPEGVEVPVEADLSAHGLPVVVGVIDLIRAGGVIVDFKTSAKTPDAERAEHLHEVQTSAYAVLYREGTGHREAGIELHHLIKTKVPRLIVTALPPMSERQQTRLFRMIESYLDGLDRLDFVPSPGMHCSGCEFFNACRQWDGRD